ncbi:uncharacterized protein BDZ99DRAFT_572011 [Mytilinidion resinicola]|uniref:Uncharacterized protein n=1 Tax=Mytilinidion resinicola TaxID=574789 RepID=A0A6A6YMK9_9PEZI|nr:uncharacterized protein BDZ99DRAFT_572011 [Mytilinidion resinicola]KAF2809224.1 hypothetical protein BDZ99DRAFT_572011 [Mytilinidion resinicola]
MNVGDHVAEHTHKLRKALTKAMQNRRPAWRRHAARPNCTHIDMDRIFGYHQCQSCGKFPSMGWLYTCRQDERFAEPLPFIDHILENESTFKSLLRAELEYLGLSRSVVQTAEKGGYTVEELNKIKDQKIRLNQVVSHGNESPRSKEIVGLGINAEAHKRKDSGMDRPSSENDPPTTNDGARDSAENQQPQDEISPLPQSTPSTSTSLNEPDQALKSKISKYPPCQLKVCHACRPYYKDRIYISFGAIFANEVPAVTADEAMDLPVANAEIVRNIGLRPRQHRLLTDDSGEFLASYDSQHTITTTRSEREDLRIMRQGPRDFYKLGSSPSNELRREFQKISLRSSLKQAFNGLFRPCRDPSSDGSNITLPLARTGRHRGGWADETDDFDLGSLKRVRSHRRLAIEQEGSLTTSGGFTSDISISEDHLDASSSSSDACSEYSSLSEGSEVEVEGGVALLEESVEKLTPDIITEDEEQIMTQV